MFGQHSMTDFEQMIDLAERLGMWPISVSWVHHETGYVITGFTLGNPEAIQSLATTMPSKDHSKYGSDRGNRSAKSRNDGP